jgi:hypothetical protein
MSRLPASPAVSVVALLAFVSGLGLLGLAFWTRPLNDAEGALRGENAQAALERYAAMEQRYNTIPVTKRALPSAFHATVSNQLKLRFELGEYDEVIEKAALSPSTPQIHFWAGCALFEKAREATKRDERVTWLNRATEEFRKTLERQPDDWDAKFNYEIARQLLGEMRQEKTAKPDKVLPLLRPEPPSNTPRRVG